MPTDFTLSDLVPYIKGTMFFEGNEKNNYKPNKVAVDTFVACVNESVTAATNLELFEDWRDFYKAEPDFKQWIPSSDRAEAFYAAKTGIFSAMVPATCIFFLKKCYDMHKSPNMIFKLLPKPVLMKYLSEGQFGGGLNMQDVVCTFCSEYYQPLSKDRLKNPCGDFTEVYITSTDMVALMPNRLADSLSDEVIEEIKPTPAGLAARGIVLSQTQGYQGVCNSVYDLRKLI